MRINDKIRDENLQYGINGEAANISALSYEKIEKYQYLTDETILPSVQRRLIEQVNFIYSSLDKALEKQRKSIEDQREKQIKTLEERGKQLVKFNSENESLTLLEQITRWLKYKI